MAGLEKVMFRIVVRRLLNCSVINLDIIKICEFRLGFFGGIFWFEGKVGWCGK